MPSPARALTQLVRPLAAVQRGPTELIPAAGAWSRSCWGSRAISWTKSSGARGNRLQGWRAGCQRVQGGRPHLQKVTQEELSGGAKSPAAGEVPMPSAAAAPNKRASRASDSPAAACMVIDRRPAVQRPSKLVENRSCLQISAAAHGSGRSCPFPLSLLPCAPAPAPTHFCVVAAELPGKLFCSCQSYSRVWTQDLEVGFGGRFSCRHARRYLLVPCDCRQRTHNKTQQG